MTKCERPAPHVYSIGCRDGRHHTVSQQRPEISIWYVMGTVQRSCFAERILSAAQQQQQRAELRRNWDFSVILDCFEVFEEELDVGVQHIDTLEDDIVCSVGIAPDRLSKIHEVLTFLIIMALSGILRHPTAVGPVTIRAWPFVFEPMFHRPADPIMLRLFWELRRLRWVLVMPLCCI